MKSRTQLTHFAESKAFTVTHADKIMDDAKGSRFCYLEFKDVIAYAFNSEVEL